MVQYLFFEKQLEAISLEGAKEEADKKIEELGAKSEKLKEEKDELFKIHTELQEQKNLKWRKELFDLKRSVNQCSNILKYYNYNTMLN